MSHRIGRFSSFIFLHMNCISEIKISGCTSINADEFRDTVIYCISLDRIEMRNCKQFSELHISQILSSLPALRYVDVQGFGEISFDCAYWLCSEIQSLLPPAYIVQREGNVLTRVCLSVHSPQGGVPIPHNALQHFPECHGADTGGGVPCQGGTLPGGTQAGGVPR